MASLHRVRVGVAALELDAGAARADGTILWSASGPGIAETRVCAEAAYCQRAAAVRCSSPHRSIEPAASGA